MTAKTSISLTDEQEAFARRLVDSGRYPSLSAVLQHGLDLLRVRQEAEEADTEALRALLEERKRGPFIDTRESKQRVDRLIAAHKPAK